MVPLIHVVVDVLVSITYVLVDIYYFYCPLSRISTTQGRHRSGAARAEAPLRQAATPRNWLRGRLRIATGRAQPEPKHRFGRRRRPATGCGTGVSNNRCCRTKKFRLARRRAVPEDRTACPFSASGKPIPARNRSVREETITPICRLSCMHDNTTDCPLIHCRACTTDCPFVHVRIASAPAPDQPGRRRIR